MSRSVSAPSSVTKTSPCWNGLIVPGSTLMYGSSLRLVTRTPRLVRMAASDAAAMPLPSEETTPPVTNTNLVMGDKFREIRILPERARRVVEVARITAVAWVRAQQSAPSPGAAQCAPSRSAGVDAETGREALAGAFASEECKHRVDGGG